MFSKAWSSPTTRPAAASLACCFTESQSTAAPFRIEAATPTSLASSGAFMRHLLCQPNQRAADGHMGGGHARLVEGLHDLEVAEAQRDSHDDGLAVGVAETVERGLVARQRLLADGFLER